MKKNLLLTGLATLSLGLLFTSCESDNPEYDDTETILVSEAKISYDDDGVWDNNNVDGFINIDDYEFSHYFQSYDIDGYKYDYVYGFTPSKINDTTLHTPLYQFAYASMSGGGVNGAGTPYLVGFWDPWMETDGDFNTRSCRVFAEDGDTFMPQSVMVNNNSYVYYTLLNGSDFNKPFGQGDWVTLTAHGVHPDNSESTAVIYLANITTPGDVASGIVTKWTEFDLSGLGVCTGIYFTMASSDNTADLESGMNTMNTPAYFCIDKLVVKD